MAAPRMCHVTDLYCRRLYRTGHRRRPQTELD